MKERAQEFHFILTWTRNALHPREGGRKVRSTPVWLLASGARVMRGWLVLAHLPAFPVIDGPRASAQSARRRPEQGRSIRALRTGVTISGR